MFKHIQLIVATACLLQIHAMSLQQMLEQNNEPAAPVADAYHQQTVPDFAVQLSEFVSSLSPSAEDFPAARQATNGTSGALSTILSNIVNGLTTAISPALGPFAPLATIGGPLITNALNGLLTNAFAGLGGILQRDELPGSGYEAFMVNVPNQGSYILLAKRPELLVTPTATAADALPQLNQLNLNGNGGILGLNGGLLNRPQNAGLLGLNQGTTGNGGLGGLLGNLFNRGNRVQQQQQMQQQQQPQLNLQNLLAQISGGGGGGGGARGSELYGGAFDSNVGGQQLGNGIIMVPLNNLS